MPIIDSLVGSLSYQVNPSGALTHLFFGEHHFPGQASRELELQLEQFFSRSRQEFNFPLAPEGSRFQMSVWEQLQRIPYGETRSYIDIARALGDAGLTRAVGSANHANPIAILIPCHRVIGASGQLVGFGGGLDIKAKLLDFESGVRSLFDQPE